MNERIRFLFCASLGGAAFESGMIGNSFGDLGTIGKVTPLRAQNFIYWPSVLSWYEFLMRK